MPDTKELIILGCGPTHVECQFDCEVWGVNGTYTFAKRLDKLFMSDEDSEVEACWYDYSRLLELKDTTLVFPMMYTRFKGLPLNIEIYPIEDVLKKFPTRFFSNSIAYMIAYALLKTKTIQTPDDALPRPISGYHKIKFYGIDMMNHSTYIQEKGGVEYWMGVALGMGVEVVNTVGSATGKTFNGKMYGHYGKWEDEMLKEQLLMPWEFMRVAKTAEDTPDWIRNPVTGEWECNRPVKVAGDEIVTPK